MLVKTVVELGNSFLVAPCNSIVNFGISVPSNLKPALHCITVVFKVSARYKLILKLFLSRGPLILTRAFATYVRLVFEYCTPAWSPRVSMISLS